MADDVLILNDYGAGSLKQRTSKTGRQRVIITIESEPLLVQTDPRALTREPAEAIAEHLRQRIRAISAKPADNTVRARHSALAGLVRGKQWAQQRYSGGRMGTRQPDPGGAAFNDSGRLADGIAVGPTKDGWVVNVPGNRLDPNTTSGIAGVVRIVNQIRMHVPEFGDGSQLVNVLSVKRAIRDNLTAAIQKANDRTVELKKRLMQTATRLLLRLAG